MTDEETVARTVWGEARGEPFNGKIAIAWVIRNRVELDLHGDEKPDWWGEGYEAVCLKPWQFSCWNANDPNREKLLAVTDADAMYRDSLDAARLVIAGKVDDPTGGATHYFNPDAVKAPQWAFSGTETARIGHHLFFKGVA